MKRVRQSLLILGLGFSSWLLTTMVPVSVQAQIDPVLLQLTEPLDRIQYYVPNKTQLANPLIKDSYQVPLKLQVAQPQTRLTIIANFNSPFAKQFFIESLPKLRDQYADSLELQMIPASLGYFDKNIEVNTLTLIECLKIQNQFWPNITKLAEYAERPLDTSYLLGVDQAALKSCLNGISEVDKETMYQDALRAFPTYRLSGIPTFVVEDATVLDKMGILLMGNRPAEFFSNAFDRIHTELSVSQIKELQTEVAAQRVELASLQQKLSTYEQLSFWQKLKLLVGIKPI